MFTGFDKFLAVFVANAAVAGINWANSKYHLGVPLPGPDFQAWVSTFVTSLFVYFVPNK